MNSARPSASIAAINVDIAVGEVAGPDRGLAAPDAEVDVDVDFAALHMRGDRGFVIAGHRPALLGDADAANGDRERVAVGFFAAICRPP